MKPYLLIAVVDYTLWLGSQKGSTRNRLVTTSNQYIRIEPLASFMMYVNLYFETWKYKRILWHSRRTDKYPILISSLFHVFFFNCPISRIRITWKNLSFLQLELQRIPDEQAHGTRPQQLSVYWLMKTHLVWRADSNPCRLLDPSSPLHQKEN